MSEINTPIVFVELLRRYGRIEIPLIQRDYAQGREVEKDVRDDFLKALHAALSLPEDSTALPLNLDFIYGSMEGHDKRSFLPLDGQQRLTTLFLLHWYLAWRDGALPDFRAKVLDGKHARFTYGVRPSSSEFFDAIVSYEPASAPDAVSSVKRLLQDQSWFFLYWRLDPTIQSTLTMLDAIHERFKNSIGFYARLVEGKKPVITFQLLPLEHFGLTDDLYIKMNARGKPLTAFETFKARFEELLKELFPVETRKIGGSDLRIASFVASRMDTQWTDFFWGYKNKDTHTFDDALMNLLWALARVSLNPSDTKFADDTTSLRNKYSPATYTHFHDRGWLTRDFALNLICLIEAWSQGGSFARQLPDDKFFNERSFFESAIFRPAEIEYGGLISFAAFVFFLRQHDGAMEREAFQEWMRVVFNLMRNTDIERPEDYGRCLAGLKRLLPHSQHILQHLAEMVPEPLGFSPQQVREEALKAKLLLAHPAWRPLLHAAEEHGYFRGQIEFLLEFTGVVVQAEKVPVKDWDEEMHTNLQTTLDQYLKKTRLMFTKDGLAPNKPQLWKTALLAVGSYLSSSGRNESFLTDSQGNWDSWKRLLRNTGSQQRQHVKSLLDRIDAASPVEAQLNRIMREATDLEPWRAAVVKHPEIIDYCGQQEIRREGHEVYLLKRRQMNGFHAELFSYALYQELDSPASRSALKPLDLQSYESVTMTAVEPYISLALQYANGRNHFQVFSSNGKFRIQARKSELAYHPNVSAILLSQCGFNDNEGALDRSVLREEIHIVLQQLASSLAKLPGVIGV